MDPLQTGCEHFQLQWRFQLKKLVGKKKQLFKSLWHLGASGDWTSCLEPCFFFFQSLFLFLTHFPSTSFVLRSFTRVSISIFLFFSRELILKNTLQTSHSIYYCQCHMHTLITNYCIYKKKHTQQIWYVNTFGCLPCCILLLLRGAVLTLQEGMQHIQ